MHAPSLLISGVGRRNHLLRLVTEQCRRRGVEVIGADGSPLAAARAELARFEQLPLVRDPDFKGAYARVLEAHEPLAYLTLIDPEITALAMLASEEPFNRSRFLHPPWATAEVCEDKFAFFKHLESHGLPGIPTSLSPIDTFPQIRKDRRGSGASGFCVYPDAGALPADESPAAFIYQPFCADRYFCADVYYSLQSGELIDVCVKEVEYRKNGESLIVRSVPSDPFIDVLRAAGEAFDLQGITNFDIFGTESSHSIMEINCRIGGNYPATHAFGVNLLDHLLAEVLDGVTLGTSFSTYAPDRHVSSFPGFTEPHA